MRAFLIFFFAVIPFGFAQEATLKKEALLEFREVCWFDDELGTAVVYAGAEEEPTVVLPYDNSAFRFFGSEVLPLKDDERGSYAVVIEFQPRQVGLNTFPSIRLESGEDVWESSPKQILVGETRSTSEMELTMEPVKTRVYAGEPIRVDFLWRSAIPFKQLRDFRLSPGFFSDASVKVVAPRSQVPEDEQIGLPVGSRRIIGQELIEKDENGVEWLNVAFSVYLKFEDVGEYELPPTRLLCSRLMRKDVSANRYAAYFSNGLFERVGKGEVYEKLETFAPPLAIQVLPLPEKGRLESFSGLFAPVAISVSSQPQKLQVGQLMELNIEVESEAVSEMLELPPLSIQSGLRHRFWVGEEMNRTWKPNGRLFTARMRPLTTEARYLPSFEFQIFNPETGSYEMKTTDSIPLSVEARDGQGYFAVADIPGLTAEVVGNSEGIWHNKKANTMDELLNKLIGLMADGFWWMVLLGPILFFVFLPWVRERRRRALDEDYMRRRSAFERFNRSIANKEEPVGALTQFVAECYDTPASAFTARDAGRLLRKSGADEELIQEVTALLRATDPKRFSSDKEQVVSVGNLGAVGSRIFDLLAKSVALIALIGFLNTNENALMAADWTVAEESFSGALKLAEQSVDSSEIESKFVDSALEFEACAIEGLREGIAWYNAGNAWFKAGELGRAIASYRRAQAYRPFDEEVSENLKAARALRVDSFGEETVEPKIPARWILAGSSLSWLLVWGVALAWLRYRNRWTQIGLGLAVCLAGALIFVSLRDRLATAQEAVLIVDESYGRKGPGYAYASAFSGPLHNGIEFQVIELREAWLKAELSDGSVCWLPAEAVSRLEEL